MSILDKLKPCSFQPPEAGKDSNGKDLKEITGLIIDEGNFSFKRKVTIDTVNNITYAQDNGKEATKIICNFLFFDNKKSVLESQELLEKLLNNPDSAQDVDETATCYEQAYLFRELLLQKPTEAKPAILKHPLYPKPLKVVVTDVKEIVGFTKDIGMAKLTVTFVVVDRYGVAPQEGLNKDSVEEQNSITIRSLLEVICPDCYAKIYGKKDIMSVANQAGINGAVQQN